jgi:hypothetical protein
MMEITSLILCSSKCKKRTIALISYINVNEKLFGKNIPLNLILFTHME